MKKLYKENYKEYGNKYTSGYGLQYPEGYIIRVCKQLIQFQEKMSNPIILDYGCGNGVHLEYFNSLWPTSDLFGLDISSNAIEQAKERTSLVNAKLEICKPVPDINDIYSNQKYDLILSNQVLYYLEDEDVKNLINQFYKLLNKSGIIIISWMGVENHYFGLSRKNKNSSLRTVSLKGRLKEKTQINFKNKIEFSNFFSKFKKISLGYYDTIIREDEGSTMHYFIVAKKL